MSNCEMESGRDIDSRALARFGGRRRIPVMVPVGIDRGGVLGRLGL